MRHGTFIVFIQPSVLTNINQQILSAKAHSETCHTPNIELFPKMVNI